MIKISNKEDLTGRKFCNWIVLGDDGTKNNSRETLWKCECQCENKTIRYIRGYILKHELRKSCSYCTNINKYDLSGEYGIGWISNTNKEFYFDLEDYNKIKNYCWMDNGRGYIVSYTFDKKTVLHRFIMNVTDSDIQIDHIYHNKSDNRKSQLRLATNQENSRNIELRNDNKSGATGVYWNNIEEKWIASLNVRDKIYLKRFNTYNNAVNYRNYLEQKYFGEFAYKEGEEIES